MVRTRRKAWKKIFLFSGLRWKRYCFAFVRISLFLLFPFFIANKTRSNHQMCKSLFCEEIILLAASCTGRLNYRKLEKKIILWTSILSSKHPNSWDCVRYENCDITRKINKRVWNFTDKIVLKIFNILIQCIWIIN